ncbi:hypothetical protein A4H97_26295 [Niastella yeongjuensis]|uniref:Outer membrane protein beta-barrel domain-containing protein n=1 Tax=Niastella yeongjuensis TaxID=354355 RepID=A0A1V9F0B2_9BACT|nr:hypothetical protein [Niastella yeongjuensis]OQP51725.1 hypothetical protein A4H97_26295 [Niastella yeongjuensis]SEP48938.1 hypothetical protein SAMN05660816_06855 [Niastella yeongjuensis]
MKRPFQLLFLLISVNSFAQTKPVTRPYFKIEPALVFVKDLDPAPYISAGFGGHIGRFVALGITGGYLKFEGASEAVIPLGLDLAFTDYKTKKVQPVVKIHACYPIYGESSNAATRVGSTSVNASSETKGQFMFNIGGGLAMPITAKKKFFLAASYGQLMMKSSVKTMTIVAGRGTNASSSKSSQTEMLTVSLTFML